MNDHPTPNLTAPVEATAPLRVNPLSLLAAQVKAELLAGLRVPEFVIGTVGVPVILYAMFGLPSADMTTSTGVSVAALMVASFTAYGVVSLAIFTFGSEVAGERDKGWLRRLRATPMPMWAYFAGKVASAFGFTLLIAGLILGSAVLFGGVRLSLTQILGLVGVLLAGTVAFAPFGFAIAYWFKPKAAVAISNLIFLPIAFLSGFFFPRGQLPEALIDIPPYLPTYYFGQLAWAQVGEPQDYTLFVAGDATAWWVCTLWVAGFFLICTVLTVWGYRRELVRDST